MTFAKSPSAPLQKKANYGLDAPVFQRIALFGGLAGVVFGIVLSAYAAYLAPHSIFQYAPVLVWTCLWPFLTGCVMFWGSKVGKLHLRDKIIASIAWRGDEKVLDVGCGHGLMLLAAAKHLTRGHAIGIDIWSQGDQADNNPKSTMENAQLENVTDRIELQSADARKLPFPDDTFDVIVSTFVIHNMKDAPDREQSIREIARVLKPGGQLVIADILYTGQYADTLGTLGWTDVKRWFPNFLFVIPAHVLRARKP